jgi:hypothetical protein
MVPAEGRKMNGSEIFGQIAQIEMFAKATNGRASNKINGHEVCAFVFRNTKSNGRAGRLQVKWSIDGKVIAYSKLIQAVQG